MPLAPGNRGALQVVSRFGCVGRAFQTRHRATCEARRPILGLHGMQDRGRGFAGCEIVASRLRLCGPSNPGQKSPDTSSSSACLWETPVRSPRTRIYSHLHGNSLATKHSRMRFVRSGREARSRVLVCIQASHRSPGGLLRRARGPEDRHNAEPRREGAEAALDGDMWDGSASSGA